VPDDEVIGAEGRLQGCDDVLQELVAGTVAFRVVHGFHLVDVDERDDEGCAFTPSPGINTGRSCGSVRSDLSGRNSALLI